jgi:hypothetical protein
MDINESKISTIYKIKEGSGWIGSANGNFHFKTADEAITEAKMFKENPRCHNENMSDENVKHWSSRTYVIEKETTIVESIGTI